MKILIVTRIYSGLVESFRKGTWKPRGMPAYYKLIEALDKEEGVECEIICLGKAPQDIKLKLGLIFPGMKTRFHIVPYRKIFRIGGVDRVLNDAVQFCYAAPFVRGSDLIYTDRVHIIFASFWKRLFKKKVVIRLFGIGRLIQRFRTPAGRLKEYFRYLSFRNRFDYVICSKDGSGGEYFIKRFMNRKTPYAILLNGIDRPGKAETPLTTSSEDIRRRYGIGEDKVTILFLARMSADKGPDLFVESLTKLNAINERFFALLVGEGDMKPQLKRRIAESGLWEKAVFAGSVAHNDIYAYYEACDIYVSLNLIGNVCNTVLEAVNAGRCIVTFAPDKKLHTDSDTHDLFKDAAEFVDRRKTSEELPIKLNELINNGKKREELAKRASEISRHEFISWEERIEKEIRILKKTARS